MSQQQPTIQRARIMPFVLAIAGLLFAFGFIAQEVVKGKTLAFDREVMLALRISADPRVPIGPTWLPEAARDFCSSATTVTKLLVWKSVRDPDSIPGNCGCARRHAQI